MFLLFFFFFFVIFLFFIYLYFFLGVGAEVGAPPRNMSLQAKERSPELFCQPQIPWGKEKSGLSNPERHAAYPAQH
jgi:hypothetical protein